MHTCMCGIYTYLYIHIKFMYVRHVYANYVPPMRCRISVSGAMCVGCY